MPEVFAVETSLVLNDRMLKGLQAISKELRTIDGQMKKLATYAKIGGMGMSVAQAQALEKAMRGAATGARQAAIGMRDMSFNRGVVAGAEKLNTSLGSAAVRAATLRTELAALNMPGGPGFRGPGHHGGGGGGFHGRAHVGPFGASFPFSMSEMAAILAGGAAFVGIKGAAQEQQSINAAILASGIDPRSAQGQQYSQILFGQAEQISRGSIFSPATVAKAFPSIFGLTDVPFKDALPLLMPVTRFAETAALVAQSQGQSASIEESAKSAIRMAHVLGTLDPDKMAPLLNQMLVAEQTTGTTPAQMEKVLSYFAGTGRMFGMTPAQAIQLAAISSLGQPGTRAGTSLNQMILGLLPAGGPGSGTKIHLGQKFRQNELLRMGLIDPKTGRPYSDPVQILGALAKFRQQHPQEAIEAFKKMFNTRGMRAAEWLSFAGVMDKLVELQERMKGGLDANDMQKALRMTGLIPELQSNWADLQGILTTLGSSTLPGLISGFEHLHEALDFIRGALTDDKGNATPFAKNLAYGGEALGALWLTKLLWKFAKFPFSGSPGGLPGGVPGAVPGLLTTILRPLLIGKALSEMGDSFSVIPTQGDVTKGWHGNWSRKDVLQYQSQNNWGWLGNILSEINPFRVSPAYGGEPGVGAGGKGVPITMTGTTTLNGTVTLNMGEFGALVAKMVATGISRAASGGASGSGARPDLGHPLPHPSSAF